MKQCCKEASQKTAEAIFAELDDILLSHGEYGLQMSRELYNKNKEKYLGKKEVGK